MIKRRKSTVDPLPECPLTVCLSIIGGAWTPNIIWFLRDEPRRFSELKDDVVGISPKMLTERLKKLEQYQIISRTVMPTSPPTVEYALTDIGKELIPAIDALVAAGHRLKEKGGDIFCKPNI